MVSVSQALSWETLVTHTEHWESAKHWFSKGWCESHNASVNEEVLLWSLLLFVNPFIWGSQAIRLGHNKLTFFPAVPPVSWVTWMSFFIFLWHSFSYSRINNFSQRSCMAKNVQCPTTWKHCYFCYHRVNFPFSKQLPLVDPLLWVPLQAINADGYQQQTFNRINYLCTHILWGISSNQRKNFLVFRVWTR